MANEKTIQKIKQRLASFETLMASMKELFNNDGVIDKNEQAQLVLLESYMDKIKAQLGTSGTSDGSAASDDTTKGNTTPPTEPKEFKVEKTAMSALIQGGESGSAGYNAYNRGTKKGKILGSVGPRKLVDMTIGEIKADQKRSIDDKQRLFAVGKYQMIPKTLAEGVRMLKLSDSTKYNAETQETLFADYLLGKKRPAIRAYIIGKGKALAAQMAGCKEWASIANPKTGKSYYDKGTGNSASISAADFLAALDEAKGNYNKYVGEGMDSDEAYRKAMAGIQGEAEAAAGGDTATTDKDTAATGGDNTAKEEKKIKVPEGATIEKLAKDNGVSVDDLKSWNADKLKTWGKTVGFNAGEMIIVQKGADTKTTSNPTPAAAEDKDTDAEPTHSEGKTWDHHTNRRIKTLDGRVQGAALKFVNRVQSELKLKIRVTSALRTVKEQDALFKKGGVTKARGGQSYHNYGLAIDIVEIANGKALWSTPNWKKIAAIGKSVGFEWGGDWSGFVDKPHFQMPFGKSVKELLKTKYPKRYKKYYQ